MLNGSGPRITIGIPVYNGESFLTEALDSIINQTYSSIKILISDKRFDRSNGSHLSSLCREDSRIAYVRQESNLGATNNFNFVFENCDTEYFKWQASDDLCHPQYLEKCIAELDRNPEAGWCHCKSDLVDENGESWLSKIPESDFRLTKLDDGSTWWDAPPRLDDGKSDPIRRFRSVVLGTNWCVDCYGTFRTRF